MVIIQSFEFKFGGTVGPAAPVARQRHSLNKKRNGRLSFLFAAAFLPLSLRSRYFTFKRKHLKMELNDVYRIGSVLGYGLNTEEARIVYAEVNKSFIKSISDYPQSTSNDLSFEYDFNVNDIKELKIGSTKISNLLEHYEIIFYQKLLERVGIEGDVIAKMKNITPYINENSKFLKEILPNQEIKIVEIEMIK